MRNRIFAVSAALALVALFSTPMTASADWLFTPYIGVVKGGSTSSTSTPTVFGASLAGMGAGVVGFELDFGYSPSFFGPSGTDFGDNNVTTFMGNVILGAPIGGQHGPGIRPYAVAGLGLVRQKVDSATTLVSNLSTSDFGYDLGAGVIGFFSDNVGVRGDVRYIRNFRSNNSNSDTINPFDVGIGTFNFWRITGGVTFRF